MEQNLKLSLKEEIEKEAKKIEQDIAAHPELEDIEVSEKMEASLQADIRAYENKCAKADGNINSKMDESKEFSEEQAANCIGRADDTHADDTHIVQLSEEDMKALNLGRELLRKENESGEKELFEVNPEYHKHLNSDSSGKEGGKNKGEKAKIFRMPKKKRVIFALVAVFVLVLATGVTSVGSKSYWKELIDGLLGNQNTQTINVKDMDVQETEDGDELTAYKEIREKLGILPVRLGYKPESMKLRNSSIDEEQRRAFLFFDYEGRITRFAIYENDSDSSLGQKEEDVVNDIFELKSAEQTIEVKEYIVEGYEQFRYIADFSYQGIHYQLKGIMGKDDISGLIQNLIYFN